MIIATTKQGQFIMIQADAINKSNDWRISIISEKLSMCEGIESDNEKNESIMPFMNFTNWKVSEEKTLEGEGRLVFHASMKRLDVALLDFAHTSLCVDLVPFTHNDALKILLLDMLVDVALKILPLFRAVFRVIIVSPAFDSQRHKDLNVFLIVANIRPAFELVGNISKCLGFDLSKYRNGRSFIIGGQWQAFQRYGSLLVGQGEGGCCQAEEVDCGCCSHVWYQLWKVCSWIYAPLFVQSKVFIFLRLFLTKFTTMVYTHPSSIRRRQIQTAFPERKGIKFHDCCFDNHFAYNTMTQEIGGNERSRMSTIYNHNIYARTDHLYDPLRKVLDKSTHNSILSPDQPSIHSISPHLRALSHQQAEILRSNILIPVDKELIPTHHMEKVAGKRFVAVDIEERVGKALTQEEFRRIKTQGVEEIVYQLREDQRLARGNTQQDSQTWKRPALAGIISKQTVYGTFQSEVYAGEPMQTSNGKELKAGQLAVNSTIRKQRIPSRVSPGASSVQAPEQAYSFKANKLLNSSRPAGQKRANQNYKYNLFSMMDEVGNTGCGSNTGCCNTNEVIASKINSNPWK